MKIFQKIKNIYLCNKFTCRFIDIDYEKNEVFFQYKMKSSVFKISILDAAYNKNIIKSIAQEEASWLGGFFGFYCKNRKDVAHKFNLSSSSLLFEKIHSRYKIISINRENQLAFFDYEENITKTELIFDIVMKKNEIERFDSIQAFYIGFYAGYKMKKNSTFVESFSEKGYPLLSVVR